jgi:hypothetical protein
MIYIKAEGDRGYGIWELHESYAKVRAVYFSSGKINNRGWCGFNTVCWSLDSTHDILTKEEAFLEML